MLKQRGLERKDKMIRKHKKYSRPKKPFDTVRIKAENELVTKYGLKNKREIWKAKAKLDIIRRRAKELLHESSEEEQTLFLKKLAKQGYKVENIVEILSLTEENVLDRRLQTILMKNGIATTPKGARQLITHKHILVKDKVVNIPSYHVEISEEGNIKKVGKVIKKVETNAQPDKKVESTEAVEEVKADETLPQDGVEINKNEKPLEVSA